MSDSPDYYEASYARFGIHKEMLEDKARTVAYRDAILRNAHLFKDKVVLDVGCGTGILSLFAAKAGARRVIGVELSAIHEHAQRVVEANNLQGTITILRGRIEDIELPVDKVDIIISEWMGYFLIFERMIDSVLIARDRFLKPDGLLFPDKATMYIAGIEDADYMDDQFGFWDSVYGFDMTPIREASLKEPLVDLVRADQLVTDADRLISFDLKTMKIDDLDFKTTFTIPVGRRDHMHALVVWWDVEFSACHVPITLSTAPDARATHWKQSVLYLPEQLNVDVGEQIEGTLDCTRHPRHTRCLDIHATFTHDSPAGRTIDEVDWFFG